MWSGRCWRNTVNPPHQWNDRFRHQVFPGLAMRDPLADIGGGNVLIIAFDRERLNAMPQMIGRLVLAAARRYTQVKLTEHGGDRLRIAVVPVHDPLGGISSA